VGTTVQIPTWSCRLASCELVSYLPRNSVHRDTRYFLPNPEAFWPERWLPEGMATAQSRGQEFKLDQTAYMPFSYGAPVPYPPPHILIIISEQVLPTASAVYWHYTRCVRYLRYLSVASMRGWRQDASLKIGSAN
jgi:hypothetical protein